MITRLLLMVVVCLSCCGANWIMPRHTPAYRLNGSVACWECAPGYSYSSCGNFVPCTVAGSNLECTDLWTGSLVSELDNKPHDFCFVRVLQLDKPICLVRKDSLFPVNVQEASKP